MTAPTTDPHRGPEPDARSCDEGARTVHAAFAARVRRHPHRTALISAAGPIDYGRLAARAAAVSAGLAPHVTRGDLVGVCAARSPGTVATVLGILGAGAAYVPLDPREPDERLRRLVRDSGLRTVFAAAPDTPRLRALTGPGVDVRTIGEAFADPHGPSGQGGGGAPDDPAYLIHTSGSTGRPKGVLVQHRSVLALLNGALPALTGRQIFLQLAPLHVDPSVFEIFGALLNGGTLVLPAADLSVHDIGREVARHQVSVLRLPAALFTLAAQHVLPHLGSLRLFVSGGDVADRDAVRRVLTALPRCVTVNGYGPTETTVYACWHAMRSPAECGDAGEGIPIGRPLAGVTATVVDRHLRPVPPGQEGELCVGGPGVARGYHRDPGRTAERFVPDPARPGQRAFRTGDRVRLLPDGNLAYLGRLDDQVKIRGFRVEPAETERALATHDAVARAAVVTDRTGPRTRLAAFAALTPGRHTTGPQLRAHLAALLPDPLVPAAVTVLPMLPLTPSGKTDRAALAAAARSTAADAALPHRPAATGTEERVLAIWHTVLGRPVRGAEPSVFTPGGDSLTAMAVRAHDERDWNVALPPSALFEAPTPRALAALSDATSSDVPPGDAPSDAVAPAREPAADLRSENGGAERLPLLPGQEGIWFEQTRAPGGRYNIARTYRVRGPLVLAALRGALGDLAQRQDALRVTVHQDTEGWFQRLDGDPAAALCHRDLTTLPAADREARARRLIAASAAQDPGLGAPSLLRTLVLTLDDDHHLLHFDLHHVIADDWSLELLLDGLSAHYAARVSGGADGPAPPTAGLSYAEHVRSASRPDPRRVAEAAAHWRSALADGPIAELIADRIRPAALSGRGDRVRTALGTALTDQVARAARRHGVSRFMLCTAAVHVLLAQHTEQDDLCLGALAAGREHGRTDHLIGYFVNLLAVRVAPGPDATVAGLLGAVRDACAAAYRHHDVPFPAIARELRQPPARGAAAPFPVMVNYQRRREDGLRLAGAGTEALRAAGDRGSKFELTFGFVEGERDTELEIEFSTDLYDRTMMEQFLAQLRTALTLLTGDGTVPLRRLDLRDATEPPVLPAPVADSTLHALFARQAALRPDQVAAIGPDMSLTYRQLDLLSDTVAHRLAADGVRAGDRVAICLDRSPHLMAAILGVLKAGAAYVPLDPGYPAARLTFTVQDAQARVLITSKELAETLEGLLPPALRIEHIERLTDVDATSAPPPPALGGPADLAYLIYTSGSTGQPRGVMVEHRSVVNTLLASLAEHPLDAADVWLQMTSPGFDVAAYEQFMPLVSGGTLVYCTDRDRTDPHALHRLLREHGVTVLVTVPSLLRALDRPDLAGVRVLIVAGEPADPQDTRHFARDRVVINGYGPTEAAILATTYRAGAHDAAVRVPIGRPLAGTPAQVIDRHGRPAAVGVPGELYLAGAGVGRGYWNNPERTRLLFGPLPGGTERSYRTGDRVRRLASGDLDYLGRLDGQIKLRGFRIELGEIETVLAACPGVREAAAVVTGTGPDAQIHAFLVGPADARDARDHLARHLPAHMIPATFHTVAHLPTTSHGKTDRTALAALLPPPALAPAGPTSLPATALERAVQTLWEQVLGGPAGSTEQDFFAAGGHSLKVVQLLGRIENQWRIRLELRDFLAAPTVRAVARHLERLLAGGPAEEATALVPADIRLDPEITFHPPRPATSGIDQVLLTGATGFIGAHLLDALLRSGRRQVVCLIRADTPAQARRRLEEALRGYGLRLDAADPRITVLPGDLARPGLGLDAATRSAVERGTGEVFHAGAGVHHLTGDRPLAGAYVQGTQELLRLAAAARVRAFHHISTLSVFAPGARPRRIDERTPLAGERHSFGRGYAATKWAAELLVAQAAERGAPIRVHRIGRAGGSTDGAAAHLGDMFSRVLQTSAALGCYPVHPRLAFPIVPVDVMARALVALADTPLPAGTVHHLTHPQDADLGDFLAGYDRRNGTRTVPVDLRTWVDRLGTDPLSGTPHPALVFREHLRETAENPRPTTDQYANEATLAALQRLGITLPPLDDGYIDRCWTQLDPAARPDSAAAKERP
ncbi:non-ribosomal peptide synthetase [Streptomyces sp. H39-S7]|uniref:non-ribosomal peptide synthetase n=1 Tax=Streptomyces sp. H39-S7 TaxID=3004357 RepID=UPI0022AFE324|nr:non-ribosomal peptide synthetase [Streptomyces sp. H39-S7]MCZ4125223.1 amino acid adenylation domain-containing protein [Streptomyces sp. H39-S7]